MARLVPWLLVVILVLLAGDLGAQTSNNGASVCAENSTQDLARISPDGAGGAFVTWQDFRRGNYDIYLQRIGPDGAPLWAPNGIAVCASVGAQNSPAIIADGSGGAIVAWHDYRSGGGYDIYAQRVNAAGVILWTFNGVALSTVTSDQLYPTIANDGAGGAIVAWQDLRSGQYDIFAQRINAAGTPVWTLDGVAICTATNQQQAPVIVSDGAAGAIVVWQDVRTGQWDIYGQRVNQSGVIQWTPNGLAFCAATSTQDLPRAVSDGTGGAIATWQDARTGTPAIFAQRLNAIGVALWANDGVAVCTITGGATVPAIVGSGSGGAIITWQDARNPSTAPDIYAQQVGAGGLPQWSGNGIPVCTVVTGQYSPVIAPDGADGATMAWADARYGNYDIYTQHVNSGGALQWPAEGVAICSNAAYQYEPAVTPDGVGGAVVCWRDERYTTAPDIFAQRVTGAGSLVYPDAEYPALVSVRDVPNDQGGQVKLSWKASNLDLPPFTLVDAYWIWRSAPPNLGQRALASAGTIPSLDEAAASEVPPAVASETINGTTYYWEYIASRPTGHIAAYSYVAPTTSDSVAGSNPSTAFMVMARSASGTQWWYSNVDSGYSVDNLPPGMPIQFSATTSGASIGLHWTENPEADVAEYRLYRGDSGGFEPGPSNLISAQPDTGFVDPIIGSYFYKLAALDSHGNQGPYATVFVASLVGVPVAPPASSIWLASPWPNPTHGSAVLRFGLPGSVDLTLSIVDVSGRLVRVLATGQRDAGEHVVTWNGADASGHPAPGGLYFASLNAGGRRLVQRFVRID